MPWHVDENHAACPTSRPHGVIKNSDGSLEGCHATVTEAEAHMRALYASEGGAGMMAGRHNLHVDVDWKAAGTAGEVEGYASVFGNVDQVGDVVMPGAFRKTIADWRHAAQPMPLIADHNLSTDGVIGSIADMREDRTGLWFKARFSRSEKAQRIRQDVLDGHFRGTSFTYEVKHATPGRHQGKSVRFLDELRLFEITLSPFPVNELAGLTAAKATDPDGAASNAAMADWLESMSHATAITDPVARKAAVDTLVANYPTETEPSAVTQDAADTGGDAATTPDGAGGTSTPDDAYAVAFLSGPSDGTPTGQPSDGALPGPIADLEYQRSNDEIDRLEADIQHALEG